jgi:hypothetical protein
MSKKLKVVIDENESLLSNKDIDRLIFSIQSRTQKLFVVEKPLLRAEAANYLKVSLSTFDKLISL